MWVNHGTIRTLSLSGLTVSRILAVLIVSVYPGSVMNMIAIRA